MKKLLLFLAWIYFAFAFALKRKHPTAVLIALLLLAGTANAWPHRRHARKAHVKQTWVCRQWRSEGVEPTPLGLVFYFSGVTRVLGVKCERVR